MRWIRFLLAAALAVLIQATLMRVASIRGARPDLVVAVLVVFGLRARGTEGLAVGCVLGLARDLFTQEPLGLNIGVLAMLGLALARLRPGTLAEHVLPHAILGFLCSAASSLASVLALAAAGRAPTLSMALERGLIVATGTAVLSGALAVLFPARVRRFSGRWAGFGEP